MKTLPAALRGKKCLLFLDLEGTQYSHEMIEIGAYKVVTKEDGSIKKVFPPYHAYVLAKHHVGPFVSKLTGLSDLKIRREGISFRQVQQQLKGYMGKDYEHCVPIAYGNEDAHIFLCSAENNMDASMEEARAFARRFFDYAEFFGQYVLDPRPQRDGRPIRRRGPFRPRRCLQLVAAPQGILGETRPYSEVLQIRIIPQPARS